MRNELDFMREPLLIGTHRMQGNLNAAEKMLRDRQRCILEVFRQHRVTETFMNQICEVYQKGFLAASNAWLQNPPVGVLVNHKNVAERLAAIGLEMPGYDHIRMFYAYKRLIRFENN